MTWSAARAAMIARDVLDARWTHRYVSGSDDLWRAPHDELADLVGSAHRVRAAARKTGLVPGLERERRWWMLTAMIVVAAGVGATLAGRLVNESSAGPETAVGLLLAAGVGSLIARAFGHDAVPPFGPRATARIEDALATPATNREEERKFRAALRQALVDDGRRRIVVVDHLGGLHSRTQKLIESYVRDPGPLAQEELWLLFARGRRPVHAADRLTGEPINAPNLMALEPHASFKVWRCRQRPLEWDEKVRLLQRITKREPTRQDRRLRYRAIGDVVRLPGDDDETLDELEAQLAHREPGTRRAFALLAVAATAPAPARIAPSDLAGLLRRPTQARHPPLERLLREWFSPNLGSPAAVQEAMASVARELSPLLEEQPRRRGDRGVQVAFPFADALESVYPRIRKEYALPDSDHARAFWALYWHNRLGAPGEWSAAATERLVTHLNAIRDPPALRRRHGAQVARALCDAAIDAIAAAHAHCVGGIGGATEDHSPHGAGHQGRSLVEQAHLFIAGECGGIDRRLAERLLVAGWSAYMLTGTSRVAFAASALARDYGCPTAAESDLSGLYLETVPRSDRQPPLLPRSSDAAIVDHAVARGALLALIIKPLTRRGESEWLSSLATGKRDQLVKLVRCTTDRLAAADDPLTEPLDYLTLAVVALRVALVEQRGRVSRSVRAALDRAAAVARNRQETRAAPNAPQHFVLDGVIRQFLASHDGAADVLGDLHVMWHNLELHELADLTAIARNVISGAVSEERGEQVASYLVGLDDTDDRPINRIAAELLIGGQRLAENRIKAGTVLVEAGSLCVDSDLGPRLTFELCKVLVTQSLGQHNVLTEKLLERVLDPPSGCADLFDVPDDAVADRVLPLVNCVDDAAAPVAAHLIELVVRRRERISDLWQVDRVDQYLEYWRASQVPAKERPLLENFLERWRMRIWDGVLPAPPRHVMFHLGDDTLTYDFDDAGGARACPPGRPPDFEAVARDTYTYVLQRVWDAVGRGVGIPEDAARLLVECPNPARKRAYVLLSHSLAAHLADCGRTRSAVFRRAVEVLRDGMHGVETGLHPHVNQKIYDLLAEHDAERAALHRGRAAFWQVEDERLQQEHLFLHQAARRYFDVFWYHFKRRPELPCDLDPAVVATPLGRVNPPVPDPISFDADGRPLHVSGAFLRLGHAAFHEHAPGAHADEVRGRINQLARERIASLYTLLIDTARSNELRALLRDQRRRFS